MRIINFLDATAAGDIVMGHRNFHLGVVTQRKDILHQAFAKGALADDHATVVILDGTCHDFAGRCAVAIHQYSQRDFKVDRVVGGRMHAAGCRGLAFHRHYRFAFGNKQIDNVDCLVHQTASVTAQVEDEAF